MSSVQVWATDRFGKAIAFEAAAGTTLMQAMKNGRLPVAAICGGAKSCATCHVFVEEGFSRVGVPDEDESDLLSESNHYREQASRLSCQIVLAESMQGLKVQLAPEEL